MAILITGAAGFIGSNLVSQFLEKGETVLGLDNLCRGTQENLNAQLQDKRFTFIEIDLTNLEAFKNAVGQFNQPILEVWHMAANSDIPAGIANAQIDLQDTFMTTFNTLEVMKQFGIGVLAFASSSAIYGDHQEVALYETMGPLFPISNYGAMKLASEALISAAAESYLDKAYIFRFPNVIGMPATHGVMFDFIAKLQANPKVLEVLGDGSQQKCYLHVQDLISAMFFIRHHAQDKVNFFNIGAGDDGISVRSIAELVVATFSPNASIQYGKGNKGWVGDVPKFQYSIDKLAKLGWKPRLESVDAVCLTISEMKPNL